MKKRLIGMAVIVVVLMVMFSACGDETIIAHKKAGNPSKVEVSTLNSRYVLVKWSAGKDAVGHNVYFRKDKTKSVIEAGQGQNTYTYIPNGLTSYSQITNIDPDQWSCIISVSSPITAGVGNITSGSYLFGVQAWTKNPNTTDSDIVWSKSFSVSYF